MHKIRFVSALTVLAVVFFAASADAATRTWGGTGSTTSTTNVNLGTNWSAGTVPVAGDEADFTNLGNASPTQTAATAMRFMEFLGGAPAYT